MTTALRIGLLILIRSTTMMDSYTPAGTEVAGGWVGYIGNKDHKEVLE